MIFIITLCFCGDDLFRFPDPEMLIEKRATVIDHVLAQPQSFSREVTRAHELGVFPMLDAALLNAERVENRSAHTHNLE